MKRLLETDTQLSTGDIIRINAGGGPVMMTTLNTLTKTFPQSMIARLFSRPELIPKDEQGNYFIDTDSDHFRAILNVLRRPDLLEVVPHEIDEESWLRTLDYFGIKDYVQPSDASSLLAKHNIDHAIEIILFEYRLTKNIIDKFHVVIVSIPTHFRNIIEYNKWCIHKDMITDKILETRRMSLEERDKYLDLSIYIDEHRERFTQYFQNLFPSYRIDIKYQEGTRNLEMTIKSLKSIISMEIDKKPI